MKIISRAEWGARAPVRRYPIGLPTRELWLHHTAGAQRGDQGMRSIQNFHMDRRGWSDIAYSFVIDPATLTVFEGRGAGVAGGHTKGHNTISHAICVMGNFQTTKPSDDLLDTIAELVAYGHDQGWWPARLTGGHRDASGANTACPGTFLWSRIADINERTETGGNNMVNKWVQAMQEEIESAGFSVGPAGQDGIAGPATLSALREMTADLDNCRDRIDQATEILTSPLD